MPNWKALLKRPLSIRKKNEEKADSYTKTIPQIKENSNKNNGNDVYRGDNNSSGSGNNSNGSGNLVTVIKTITTTDPDGKETTKTITYTTTEPIDSLEPKTYTFEHPPLEDGVPIESLLDKYHPQSNDEKEKGNILSVVETHPKHDNYEDDVETHPKHNNHEDVFETQPKNEDFFETHPKHNSHEDIVETHPKHENVLETPPKHNSHEDVFNHEEKSSSSTSPPTSSNSSHSRTDNSSHSHTSNSSHSRTGNVENDDIDPISKISQVVTRDFVEHYNAAEQDFSKVDHHARTTPSSKTKDIPTLSHYLTSPFDDFVDKLRAIFTWIAENIVYDVDALFSGNIHHMEASQVLHKRLAVCDGYGELFNALAKEANLEVWKISGRAKGAGYVPGADIEDRLYGHAWNAICLRGEFLLIDSTWGAGNVRGTKFVKHYEPFYFLTSPTKFIYSHLPRKDEEQYLSPPITVQEFISLPFVKPPYFAAGLSFTKRMGTKITVEDSRLELEIERTRPDESKALHAYLDWDGKQVPVFIQRLGGHGKRGGRLYRILCEIPSSGEGKLNIFVLLNGTEGPLATQFKVHNHGKGITHHSHTDSPFVTVFSVPLSFTILTPIHPTLKYNTKQRFEFVVFDRDEQTLPEFCLFTPGKDTITIPKVARNSSDGSVIYALEATLNEKGKWNLTFFKDEETLDFMAQYIVE
ncbi:5136_t:CDS:2 [Ambispora gerdemannii]|uniref:5136_t:CDS:1 n=1 Tax=Ambispora gerdemannii TaxID=144530 RepID=A0A9N8W9R1_9GLOM|nr:5136_t:CDS:2 [Ambispora gerdemannii]